MKTIKLSYSILNAWSEGRFEDAIAMYLGKQLPSVPWLELGKLKHEYWALYVLRTKELPPELGGGPIINPIVEQKYQKLLPFSDDMQILLRGSLDLESDNGLRITDYKCGLSVPSSYVDKFQLDYYKVLRPRAKIGEYICHNPYKCDALCAKQPDEPHRCYSIGIKFLNDVNAESALNHIMTYAGEIINTLQHERLLIDYTEKMS